MGHPVQGLENGYVPRKTSGFLGVNPPKNLPKLNPISVSRATNN